jgi:DNA-directed RNA polymerase specialized sigma24 family protein
MADRPTDPSPPRIPLGTRFGIWLLWLCLGLPASASVFLGVPLLLTLFALNMLEHADVPLEVWSELEPWVALLFLAGVINWWASFRHRALGQAPGQGDRSGVARQQWLLLGRIIGGVWLVLFALERLPRTELNPVLHYWALSAVIAWSSLTLAWFSGRVLSLGLAPLERRALASGPLRGSLATAGPMAALSLVAVGTATLNLDVDEAVEDSRALIEGSFKDDWSIGGAGAGGGRSRGSSRPSPSRWFDECIERIYRERLFEKGVRNVRHYSGIDAESIAAEAAIRVCSNSAPENLERYYLRAVTNGANSAHTRNRRLGTCTFSPGAGFEIPSGETRDDCVHEQLCKLPEDDRDVLLHYLMGETAPELARREDIPLATAEKRRTRAKQRLMTEARRECFD